MKVEVKTIEEYFAKAGERKPMLRQLDALIQKCAPKLDRSLFENMGGGAAIGYGMAKYKFANGKVGEWPLIGLANQKNYLAVYFCAVKDGKYIPETYKEKLGKVSVGKSCVRFNKIEKINLQGFEEVIKVTADLFAKNKNEFGRKV